MLRPIKNGRKILTDNQTVSPNVVYPVYDYGGCFQAASRWSRARCQRDQYATAALLISLGPGRYLSMTVLAPVDLR
jgi:hypothetical protein